MTTRQGKLFTAAFMTMTLGSVACGIVLPFVLHEPWLALLILPIIFYL